MPDEKLPHPPPADDSPGAAFADIPHVPVAPAWNRPTTRAPSLVVSGCVAAWAAGMLVFYLTRPVTDVDPHAPRVVAEVTGMHCPLQCGRRVAAAIERLPFARPGSVTANLKTGVVTFAVTGAEAVDEGQVRRAIERAGFGVRAVTMPPPRGG